MEKPTPLYTPAQLAVTTGFAGLFGASVLLALNERALGRGRRAIPFVALGVVLTIVLYVGYQRFYEHFSAAGWAILIITVVAGAGLGRLLGEVRGVEGRRGWLLPMALCVVNLTAVGSYAWVRARTMFPRIERTGGGIVYYGTGATAADAQHIGDWMEQSLRGGTRDHHLRVERSGGRWLLTFFDGRIGAPGPAVFEKYRTLGAIVARGAFPGAKVSWRLCGDVSCKASVDLTTP